MKYLSSVCEPATFGCNMEDILDTEYRLAWKLDNMKFVVCYIQLIIMQWTFFDVFFSQECFIWLLTSLLP